MTATLTMSWRAGPKIYWLGQSGGSFDCGRSKIGSGLDDECVRQALLLQLASCFMSALVASIGQRYSFGSSLSPGVPALED